MLCPIRDLFECKQDIFLMAGTRRGSDMSFNELQSVTTHFECVWVKMNDHMITLNLIHNDFHTIQKLKKEKNDHPIIFYFKSPHINMFGFFKYHFKFQKWSQDHIQIQNDHMMITTTFRKDHMIYDLMITWSCFSLGMTFSFPRDWGEHINRPNANETYSCFLNNKIMIL